MGFVCNSTKKVRSLVFFNFDKGKENKLINSIGKVNFKELFMESLSPEFLKLFQEKINLFYSQPFIEGISYEYGLFNKIKNTKMAFDIYKNAADFKYDYLCMYRMFRIYLVDYEDFGVKKNEILYRLYLYKCFAYLPFLILDRNYYLLNKVNVSYELALLKEEFDNCGVNIYDDYFDFLENNKNHFHLTKNDIKLMKSIFIIYFSSDLIEKNKLNLNILFQFEIKDNAYYEAHLKYCNFYLKYSGDKCDKEKINNIFDNLIKAGYYKACCDYGRFLIKEKQYEEAKILFKKGYDDGQQFCLCEYCFLLLSTSNFDQLLKDYNMIIYILKNMTLLICMDKLGTNNLFYIIYYLIKHSSFKQQIQNDFGKYAKEVFETTEKYLQIKEDKFLHDNFARRYIIEIPFNFGKMCYYGILDLINSDKERALVYFKKSYQLSKEKHYDKYKGKNYLYIYKCMKYLFKNNKITLEKLNKTKEKLFRFYEECDIDDLDIIELYNYYKLYKINIKGDLKNKLISILKNTKKFNVYYHFIGVVYREKCKKALEKEYSSNKLPIPPNDKDEDLNKDYIGLHFKTMEGQQYDIRVPKNIQFIKATYKLYNKYPDLEAKNVGAYLSNGEKLSLFDTLEENGVEDGNIIVIINKMKQK